ncbi:MAG: hypothetical protein WCF81_14905 [Roseiarcus sp.]
MTTRVERRGAPVLLAQASDLADERREVGIEVKAPPVFKVGRVRRPACPVGISPSKVVAGAS